MPHSIPRRTVSSRIERHVEVRLKDVGADHHFISSRSETINVSDHGLLMEVPAALDACVGQEVVVSLHWDDGEFESLGEIVRFESPYWRDGASSVMGIRLENAIPSSLLVPLPDVAVGRARSPRPPLRAPLEHRFLRTGRPRNSGAACRRLR